MSYNDELLRQKLSKLVDSQDSISLLSHCKLHTRTDKEGLIHHRRHANHCVRVWNEQVHKVSTAKLLPLFYLANDVLQNGRRKGDEYQKAFHAILPEAISHIYRHVPAQIQQKVLRVLDIWVERQVYPQEFIGLIKSTLGAIAPLSMQPTAAASTSVPPTSPIGDSSIQELLNVSAALSEKTLKREAASIKSTTAKNVLESSDPTDQAKVAARKETARKEFSALKEALESEISQREKLLQLLSRFVNDHSQKLEQSKANLADIMRTLESINGATLEQQEQQQEEEYDPLATAETTLLFGETDSSDFLQQQSAAMFPGPWNN